MPLDQLNRGYYYFAGAVAVGLLAVWLPWPIMLLLLWVAAGLAWFGVAYLTARGGLLFKTPEGRLPSPIKLLLMPVLFGVTVYNIFARKADNQPAMQKLRNGVWLGRRLLPTDTDLLRENNIGAILDVTAEFDTLPRESLPNEIDYLNVPVMDHEPLKLAQLRRAVDFIHERRRAGRQVLIHCALGKGRSAMAVLAYFKALEPHRDYEDLLQEVRSIRPIVRPNARQTKILHAFAEQKNLLHKPRTCLIFNPAAGKDGLSVEEKQQHIKDMLQPFLELDIIETKPDKNGSVCAREALKGDYEQILVFGGDGTVGEVACEMIGKKLPLGIIPGGTANSLAVCLYGNATHIDPVRHACHEILAGHTAKIDAASTNQGHFFLLAGIGLEAGMVEKADREKKDASGVLAYLLGGLEAVGEQQAFELSLEVDGETHTYRTGSVVIANASPVTSIFASGLDEADYEDGKLEVTVIKAGDNGDALSLEAIADLLVGSQEHDPDCVIARHKGRKIKVHAEPPQLIVFDGEIKDKTPLEIECLPGALSVFCSVREE